MIASNTTSRYYVRMNGKIRGPFDTERLRSMRQRNRIGARDELSPDRRKWVLAGSVTDIFPDGFVGVESDPNAADWYYMRSGQQQGPFALAALQALAQSSGLAPHDSVWRLGTPGWVLASQVPELAFAPQQTWWQSLHGGIRFGIIAAALLMIIAPAWMVLSYYQNQTNLARDQVRQQIEIAKFQESQDREDERAKMNAEATATGQARQKAETKSEIQASEQRTKQYVAEQEAATRYENEQNTAQQVQAIERGNQETARSARANERTAASSERTERAIKDKLRQLKK